MGGLAFEAVQDFLTGGSKDIVDPMDLVQLVFARKQGLFGDELEEDTSEPPNIHLFVIVAIRHETLRCSVPSSRNVISIGERRVLALAGAKIGKFDHIALEQDILRFDIAVEDALAVHELNSPQHLEHVELDLLEGERVLLALETLVHVHIHQLEH